MKTFSSLRAIPALAATLLATSVWTPSLAATAVPAKTDTAADVKPVAKASVPRQIVVVVADGISPQLLSFGADYIKKAFDQEDDIAFQKLQKQGVSQSAEADSLDALKGVLAIARRNGFKTGLVTSGDVSKDATVFFDLPTDTKDVASALSSTQFDFVAGGGRSNFVPKTSAGATRSDNTDLAKSVVAAGGTAAFDPDALAAAGKGKVLALQSDGDLSYSLDRDQEKEAAFEELISQSLENLSQNDAPYVLVIHDTLIAKAIAAKDTPAVAESFHQLDGIVDDLLTRQSDGNGNFAFAVLSRGAAVAPYLTSDKAPEISNTFFVLSNLPLTFTGAGQKLKGADVDAISDFATFDYKAWKVSSGDKSAIAKGALEPEKAIRASYEPALQIGYKDVAALSSLWSLGVPASDNALAKISEIVATKPALSTTPATKAAVTASAAPVAIDVR